jgi:hypothetical protein
MYIPLRGNFAPRAREAQQYFLAIRADRRNFRDINDELTLFSLFRPGATLAEIVMSRNPGHQQALIEHSQSIERAFGDVSDALIGYQQQ